MRAGRRLAIAAFVAGLSLAPVSLHAQDAAQNSAAPAADPIGPDELRDFNLQGTVTRQPEPAATPPARAPTPAPRPETPAPRPEAPAERDSTAQTAPPRAEPNRASGRPTSGSVSSPAIAPPPTQRSAAPAPSRSSITVDLPPARAASASAFPSESPAVAPAMSPDPGFALWPWLLAAIALGAGGAYLLWRRNQREEAFAGGPQASAFVAPTPHPSAPPPTPAPPRAAEPTPAPPIASPPPAAAPMPSGIIATRLRPWLDVEFEPDRCIVEDERVVFEFELDVENVGTVPATDVRVAIQLFNATPGQEAELADFFAETGEGANRAPDILPYKKFELKPQIVVPREKLRVLEAGGRQFFVPLIAISILYRGGNIQGQSAAGFLLGRETGSEKLAPFRVDLGKRIYRGLGTRILPGNIRR